MNLSDVQEFQVDSIPVILRSTDSFGDIVSIEIAVRGPATIPSIPGTVDLLLAAITDGTKSYSKEEIDRIFVESGAIHHLDAKGDYAEASLKCLKRFLPKLLPVLSEILTVPKLDPKDIEVSRMQMMHQLENEQVEPDQVLQLLSSKNFYGDHPYSRRPGGYLDTLPKVKREDLLMLLPKLFNRNNMTISVVGNLHKNEVENWIHEFFGHFPVGEKSPRVEQPIQNPVNGFVFQKVEAPTNYFTARFKAPTLMSDDYPPLVMVTQILDNRLFEEVRTKRALTYAVHAGIGNSSVNSGYVYVSSTDLPQAIRIIFEEIRKIQSVTIDANQLNLQIRKYTSSWYMNRETASSQTSIFNLYEMIGSGWKNSNGFLERLQKVTPKEMQDVAKKYFKDFSFAIVGPTPIQKESIFKDIEGK